MPLGAQRRLPQSALQSSVPLVKQQHRSRPETASNVCTTHMMLAVDVSVAFQSLALGFTCLSQSCPGASDPGQLQSDPRIEGGILGPSSHANTARKGEGWQRSTISLQGSSWQRASLTLRIPAADPSRTTGWRVVPVGQGRKCARSMTDRASCPRELASLAESNQAKLRCESKCHIGGMKRWQTTG